MGSEGSGDASRTRDPNLEAPNKRFATGRIGHGRESPWPWARLYSGPELPGRGRPGGRT